MRKQTRLLEPLACVATLVGAVLATSSAARAADVPGNYSLPLPPPTVERPLRRVEVFSGWYLRGDLGYRLQRIGAATTGDPLQVPLSDGGKIENAALGGLGVGYKWDWFRADLTGDYGWRSRYTATTAGVDTFTGKIDDFTVMANGYLDLGNWSGITPYIGAGIGGAYVMFSQYTNPTAIAPLPSTDVNTVHRWNLAWAAMAGVSYNVTRDFLIDVGYRHIEMGDVDGGPNGTLTIKHLRGDEIRVGFRYLLD